MSVSRALTLAPSHPPVYTQTHSRLQYNGHYPSVGKVSLVNLCCHLTLRDDEALLCENNHFYNCAFALGFQKAYHRPPTPRERLEGKLMALQEIDL